MESLKLSQIFRVLSNPRRVEILRLLLHSDGAMSSSLISDRLEVSRGQTSHNLRALFSASLLGTQKSGRYVYYFPDRVVMAELVEFLLEHPKDDEDNSEVA